jgi:hypothetical protein
MSDAWWDRLDGAGLELQPYGRVGVHRESERSFQDAQVSPGPRRHEVVPLEGIG